MSKSFRIWTAVLAGCQVVVAGAALADLVGARYAAVAALAVAAAQAGTAVYRNGDVTEPEAD
ncbi:hypothetical protein [Dactylosporangium sp. CA-139066]|uniref:hypothetical protein n=1 Tax=Dactylosporangium sp. CA-139066 TaxID=3239930 RepID=UPI003D8ACA9B